MNYRLTVLTPLLVGDGQELAPIDYMVWKDQVNVLDQPRIFKLLSRGPRLDGYLAQLRRADKLDFASWGGFAQNFSERRIPFEHSSSTAMNCFPSLSTLTEGCRMHLPSYRLPVASRNQRRGDSNSALVQRPWENGRPNRRGTLNKGRDKCAPGTFCNLLFCPLRVHAPPRRMGDITQTADNTLGVILLGSFCTAV